MLSSIFSTWGLVPSHGGWCPPMGAGGGWRRLMGAGALPWGLVPSQWEPVPSQWEPVPSHDPPPPPQRADMPEKRHLHVYQCVIGDQIIISEKVLSGEYIRDGSRCIGART